jgi:hypothetical protein
VHALVNDLILLFPLDEDLACKLDACIQTSADDVCEDGGSLASHDAHIHPCACA